MINFVVKVKWTLYEIMPIEIHSTKKKTAVKNKEKK